MTIVYKIFRPSEFAEFLRDGRTDGAPIDRADGYIHLSTAEQVAETAAKHFEGEEGLKLLGLDAEKLGGDLKWEPSRGGQLFPHLYRVLTAEDVEWSKELPLLDGRHEFAGLLQ